MKFYDDNKEQVSKSEFLRELKSLITNLKIVKVYISEDLYDSAIEHFEDCINVDFLYHTLGDDNEI